MVLFPVTPNHQEPPHFHIVCCLSGFYILIVGGNGDFKCHIDLFSYCFNLSCMREIFPVKGFVHSHVSSFFKFWKMNDNISDMVHC